MSGLRDVLEIGIRGSGAPGAVAVVARGTDVELQATGFLDIEGSAPMTRETIFRVASLSKPITAAAFMVLVDDGRIALDDPVDTWLPELAAPSVVRTPESSPDDVVAAERSITVEDVMSSRAGYGFPEDFSLPAVGLLIDELKHGSPVTTGVPAPDDWMAALARIPMLYQPGQAWLYNTCSDIQGVLVARVSGQPLGEFLSERIFEPLGMIDTGFEVAPAKLDRFTSLYRPGPAGLDLVDRPDGQWSRPPSFPSGAGGLVSTADDWLSFGRMLLAGGTRDGRRVLSAASVAQLTTNHLTADQRHAGRLFLEAQGWGFGGSVDINTGDAWTTPGRYGWVGGTGTSAHIIPALDAVTILLTQVELTNPTPPALMRDFWEYAAGRLSGRSA